MSADHILGILALAFLVILGLIAYWSYAKEKKEEREKQDIFFQNYYDYLNKYYPNHYEWDWRRDRRLWSDAQIRADREAREFARKRETREFDMKIEEWKAKLNTLPPAELQILDSAARQIAGAFGIQVPKELPKKPEPKDPELFT